MKKTYWSTAFLLIILLALSTAIAGTQDRPASVAAFEAVTIKPAGPKDPIGTFPKPGMLRIGTYTLRRLIKEANGMQPYQVLGGPSWIDNDQYTIVAKASFPAGFRQMLEMLNPMMADRFQLKTHRETREVQGYALV